MTRGHIDIDRLAFHRADRLSQQTAGKAQFIDAGAADIGIIALAIALAPSVKGKGKFWEIPLEAFPRMTQGAAILKAARDKGNLAAASEFYGWIKSPSSQVILKRYGFFLPEGRARN